MNNLKFVSAFVLVLAVGLRCSTDDLGLVAVNPIDGPRENDGKPDSADDHDNNYFIFEDFSEDKAKPESLGMVKYGLNYVLGKIPDKIKYKGTIRYQDNRFWNLTFHHKSSSDVFMHFSAVVNLEIFQATSNQYEPLSDHYYIEVHMSLELYEMLSTKLVTVKRDVDKNHLDASEVNMLKEALTQIQDKLGLNYTVRYRRFLAFKYIDQNRMQIQFAVILEKKSNFCSKTSTIPCPIYVPIHDKCIDSIYNIKMRMINTQLILTKVENLKF